MQKNNYQKLYIKIGGILIIGMLIFIINSCKKDNTSAGNTGLPPSLSNVIDLNALKNDYTTDTTQAGLLVNSNSTGQATKIIKSLNVKWDKVYYQRRTKSRVMEFELEKPAGNIAPVQPVAGQNIKYYDKTSLVFIEPDSGSKMRFFMKVLETVKDSGKSVIQRVHYNNIPATFTGQVLYYSLDKKFINGYYYQNGKLINGYLPQGSNNGSNKTTQATGKKVLNTYFCIDWYWGNDYDGWEYLGTDCYLITNEGNGGDVGGGGGGNGGCSVPNPDPGPGHPTIPDPGLPTVLDNIKVLGGKVMVMDAGECGTGTPPNTQNIIDSLRKHFPCASKLIIDSLAKIPAYVDFIQPFLTNTKPDLTWKDGQLPWNASISNNSTTTYKLGETESDKSSSTITLNTQMLQNSSQLFIASTAIHETLHAYLNYAITWNNATLANGVPLPLSKDSWLGSLDSWSSLFGLPPNYSNHNKC